MPNTDDDNPPDKPLELPPCNTAGCPELGCLLHIPSGLHFCRLHASGGALAHLLRQPPDGLCDCCRHHMADPDMPVPPSFRGLKAVCYTCSEKLAVLAERRGDFSGEMDV